MKRMYLSEYVRHTAGTRLKEYKLVNRELIRGYVLLTDEEYRFIQSLRVEEPKIRRRRNYAKMPHRDKLNVDHVPPCIVALVREAVRGANLTHQGRFALVAFMSDAGVDSKETLKIFAAQPDFSEFYTEYQINHIYDGGYHCPNCDTMKHNKLCVADADPLCAKCKHPSYYFRVKSGCK